MGSSKRTTILTNLVCQLSRFLNLGLASKKSKSTENVFFASLNFIR